jgi:hypothetical protein
MENGLSIVPCEEAIRGEVGSDFSILADVGPGSNWAGAVPSIALIKNKGKGIMVDTGDVAMKDRELYNGGCSIYPGGPVGPNQIWTLEYQFIKLLKDKEVAKLAFDYEKEVLGDEAPISGQRLLVKNFKNKKVDDINNLCANAAFSSFTKAGRLVRAINEKKKGGKNSKKGKKKKSKAFHKNSVTETDDPISEDSACSHSLQRLPGNNFVPVASLEVVLTEGESNLVMDEANRRYWIEAERLFNIGLNLGATTNSERIEMVEKLLDMEVKEIENIEDWEEEEVDQ